jgi:hypothetical protein
MITCLSGFVNWRSSLSTLVSLPAIVAAHKIGEVISLEDKEIATLRSQ